MRRIAASSSFCTLMRLLALFSTVHALDCIGMVCSYNRRPSSLATANVSPGCAARPSVECPASIHVACLSASVSSNRVTSVSDFVYATQRTHIRRCEEPKQKNVRYTKNYKNTRFENASTSPVFCDAGWKDIASPRAICFCTVC